MNEEERAEGQSTRARGREGWVGRQREAVASYYCRRSRRRRTRSRKSFYAASSSCTAASTASGGLEGKEEP